MTKSPTGQIHMQVMWNRLISVVEEQAQALLRTAFGSVVREAGDLELAQQSRVLAERVRRLLERIRPLPDGERYPFSVHAWQMGDAIWVVVEGEPYYTLQQELTARFPDKPVIVVPLANGARSSYMPTRESYREPLYQVDVSLLAPGCLEAVIDEIATQIDSWLRESDGTRD